MRRTVLAALLLTAGTARADDDLWQVRSSGNLRADGGFVTGFPSALPTGLSTGLGAGVTRGMFGARATWGTATESSSSWTVTQQDFRLLATAALTHDAGRGTLGVRAGLGGTFVREHRVRQQGQRAGLMGSDLESTAWAALPTADLEAVIVLRVRGPWAFAMSGGPTLERRDGGFWGGWTAELGVAWQP